MRLGLREKKDLREIYRRRRLRKIKFISAGAIAVFLLISFVVWGPTFRLKTVVALGPSRDDLEAISQLARSSLLDNAGILPASLLFSLPTEKVKTRIMDEYPDIEDITFEWKDRNTVLVRIKDRLATFLWCGEIAEEAISTCYYMSPDGVVLGEAPIFSGSHYIEFYGPLVMPKVLPAKSGESKYSGGRFSQLATSENLRLLLSSIDLGVALDAVRVVTGEEIELYTKDGWFVKINSNDTVFTIKKRLDVALATPEVKNRIETRMLSYIDARYDNKIFFK